MLDSSGIINKDKFFDFLIQDTRRIFHANKKLRKMAACLMAGMLLSLPAAFAAPLDLTLDNAVKMALDTNPTGKMAIYDFEASKGALTAARSYRWPTVAGVNNSSKTWAGDTANLNNGKPNGFMLDKYTNYLNFNWTLWAGNKIESQVSQAKLTVDSNQWGVALSRQSLKFNATDAFYKLMGARDYVTLCIESVDRLEQYLRDVRLQFEVGVVAKVDVLRSEVSLAQAQQNLIDARNAYDLAMANLNNIIGTPPDDRDRHQTRLG